MYIMEKTSRKRRRVDHDTPKRNADGSKRRSKKERKDKNGELLPRMKSEADLEKERLEKERGERTIFIGNVPISATKKDIKRLCKEAGTVESLRIRSFPIRRMQGVTRKVLSIQKISQEGRDSMSAYVVYEDLPTAKKAVEMLNGKMLLDKHIRVDMAESSKSDNSVFVGNLPFNIEDEDLYKAFEEYGVKSVRVIRDKETMIGKGFGYVSFDDASGLTKVLGADIKVRGRALRIRNIAGTETQTKSIKASAVSGKKEIKKKGKDKRRWRDREGGIEGERKRRLASKTKKY